MVGASLWDDVSTEDEDEDEEECRVCRGNEEESRPLFSPCKCSGSIGLVHQDCLKEWLASKQSRVQKCELCSVPFHFAPRYAEGTPSRLPFYEVVVGIIHRSFDKWLPFAVRVAIALATWFFLLPLSTAYVYCGLIRGLTAAARRWKINLLVGDTMAGLAIATLIIVSFLSLMSFGDFLRFHWQQVNERRRGRRNGVEAGAANERDNLQALRNGADNMRPVHRQREQRAPPQMMNVRRPLPILQTMDEHNGEDSDEFEEALDESSFFDSGIGEDDDDDDGDRHHLVRQAQHSLHTEERLTDVDLLPCLPDVDTDAPGVPRFPDLDADQRDVPRLPNLDAEQRDVPRLPNLDADQHNTPQDRPIYHREQNHNFENVRVPLPQNEQEHERPPAGHNEANNRFEPVIPPLGAAPADDDLHFELEELLGLHGHVSPLIKKFLWLLTFNVIFLGLFAFIPHSIGWNVYSALIKLSFIRDASHLLFAETMLKNIVNSLIEEAERKHILLQLPDVAALVVGYLSMSFFVFLLSGVAKVVMKYRMAQSAKCQTNNGPDRHAHLDGRHPGLMGDRFEGRETQDFFVDKLLAVIECSAGIVKVGVLLFLKMLVLPLFLGVSLDVATVQLFEETIESRFHSFGDDLFGSFLIHWVMGISFMLFVTVSVLQLREVTHPELFARLIRPQEPQPDLLGNLLDESGWMHSKRMLTSLAIYLGLLAMHVWVPAVFFTYTGLASYLPFFRPVVNHISLPQLLIPLELLGFHFCMLALLEKYKNSIGRMQHEWLLVSCRFLGLTEYIIPREVAKFVYLGSRHVCLEKKPDPIRANSGKVSFESEMFVDSFWTKLINSSTAPSEEFVAANLDMPQEALEPPVYETGLTKKSGHRHLLGSQPNIRFLDYDNSNLPTVLGPYRLRRQYTSCSDNLEPLNGDSVIEFWKEVAGSVVRRPPEGWDDLGDGGAEVQGRWAWGDEKKSQVEESVSRLGRFEHSHNKLTLFLRLLFLVTMSWVVAVVCSCIALNLPIIIGRSLSHVMSLPDRCIHDPMNILVGVAVLISLHAVLLRPILFWTNNSEFVLFQRTRQKCPPLSAKKMRILAITFVSWVSVGPFLIGAIYEACMMRTAENWVNPHSSVVFDIGRTWLAGFLFLSLWVCWCCFDLKLQHVMDLFGLEVVGPVQAHRQQQVDLQPLVEGEGPPPGQAQPSTKNDWKGSDGRLVRFVQCVGTVFFGWEWDSVSADSLLNECTFPMFRSAGLTILCTLCLLCTADLSLPFLSATGGLLPQDTRTANAKVDSDFYAFLFIRFSSILVISMQLASYFREPLGEWFEKAHKVARDERYLVGEILLDYMTRLDNSRPA